MSVTSDTAEVFDFGRVTAQVTGLISRNLVPFSILAVVLAGLPTFLVAVVTMVARPDPLAPPGVFSGAVLGLIIALIAILPLFLLQAALTRASIDDLTGKPVSIPNAVQTGLQKLLPLLGLALLVGLGVGVGMMLFIVPGLILATCWIVASPVLVVERAGVWQAMQRSLALTRNHRWAMFGIIVLYFVASIVLGAIEGLVLTGSVGLSAMAALQTPGIAFGLLNAVVQTGVMMISTVAVAAIYFELRRIKEGVGVTELASVFD